eukprot:CAMPEP_0197316186 /NCGR_PEP_ID=MMETSP0891-20130614/41560_1 /TAXON_ID=44058 ORGANISM="Aureoumbra lagunensis, Strain CCMP1510" /NCGR_SAMPLE_ID=MMETSP0891 /ASSEMBLY_ACC=CAM_ASM_000534 /LENGTH=176 /DNA_ID=CAMNT_0042805549 /DNA_START=1 /DNA_END=528 /DNA_ORIENTATION=+
MSYEEWQKKNQEWQKQWQEWQRQHHLHMQQQQLWTMPQTQYQQAWQQQWGAYRQQPQQPGYVHQHQQLQQPYGVQELRHHHFAPRPYPPNIQQQTNLRCEPCDKVFRLRGQYDAHMTTHERCSFEGCEFSACKRVLQAHFETAHGQYQGTGLKIIEIEGQKFQVLLGTDPEEVTKW